MRSSLVKLILTFLLCFSLVITPACAFSLEDIASWLNNAFRGITGYTIFENETTTTTSTVSKPNCPYECCPVDDPTYEVRACEYPKNCVDNKCVTTTTTIPTTTTTTTTNITSSTTTSLATTTTSIITTGTTLLACPYECCSTKDPIYQNKACEYPKVCVDGKCTTMVATTATTATTAVQITCTDSDGGKDYYVKGTAKDRYIGEKTDYCYNERNLEEYWCQDSGDGRGPIIYIGMHWCDYGCKDGICMLAPSSVCGNGACESEEEKVSCSQDCKPSCYQDSDCGQQTTTKTCDYPGMKPEARLPGVSYACTVEYKSICQNPGIANSQCTGIGSVACMPCELGCQNGLCLSNTPSATPVGVCNDYDGLNYYLKSYVEGYGNKYYDTCRVINSDTDYYDTDECSENCYVLEASCTDWGTPRTRDWKCPSNVCKDGACVKVDVREQVRCVFANVNSPQTCFTDDKKFSCSGTGSCAVDVNGEKGSALFWRSTCGDYISTALDGNNDDARFSCIPPSDVTENQISGRAFDRAYWQCYDGAESAAEDVDGVSCNAAEIWKNTAETFCKGHCKEAEGITKCGVNSFGVSGDCYVDMEKFVVAAPVEEEQVGTETRPSEMQPTEIALICKDSCPLEGKCYPFGYRKGGEYCSDEGAFKEQLKEDSACENNFECSTNVCVDGKCISSSLIQKIIDFFKGIFGLT